MRDQVITQINQLTADWLTTVLTRSGALRMGRVRDFEAHLLDSTNARFAAIRPVYSRDATGRLHFTPRTCACPQAQAGRAALSRRVRNLSCNH